MADRRAAAGIPACSRSSGVSGRGWDRRAAVATLPGVITVIEPEVAAITVAMLDRHDRSAAVIREIAATVAILSS